MFDKKSFNKQKLLISKNGKEELIKLFTQYKELDDSGNVKTISDWSGIDLSVSPKHEIKTEPRLFTNNELLEEPNSMDRNLVTYSNPDYISEIPPEDTKEGYKLFKKDVNELKKVAWWRNMKLIFIIICLIFAVVLYVATPIIMRNKKYFNKSNGDDGKTINVTNSDT
jgi:hypothetical protein